MEMTTYIGQMLSNDHIPHETVDTLFGPEVYYPDKDNPVAILYPDGENRTLLSVTMYGLPMPKEKTFFRKLNSFYAISAIQHDFGYEYPERAILQNKLMYNLSDLQARVGDNFYIFTAREYFLLREVCEPEYNFWTESYIRNWKEQLLDPSTFKEDVQHFTLDQEYRALVEETAETIRRLNKYYTMSKLAEFQYAFDLLGGIIDWESENINAVSLKYLKVMFKDFRTYEIKGKAKRHLSYKKLDKIKIYSSYGYFAFKDVVHYYTTLF